MKQSRKRSLDTLAPSKDVLHEDEIYQQPVQIKKKIEDNSPKFQKIQPDTILEQAEESTQIQQEEQSQEDKDKLLINKMMKMMENLEQKFKSIKNEYVQDRESAKVELQIEKQLQNIESLQTDLEQQIQIQKENVEQADLTQDLKTGKDSLLLNLVSQVQKIQNQNESQQKILLEKEQEEKRQKDEKIKELEQMIQKLKEENESIMQKSFLQSKQVSNSQIINESPQQIKKKFATEAQKEIWLPQNELTSNDFTYFSSNSSNKVKLKPIHVPHYEYIPPPKTNILQSSLNKELYRVAQSNRNVFLQAIKVDGTQRHKTPVTSSKEKYQILNTPQSEPMLGNKYRIKQIQMPPNQSQKNIFQNYLSTESLMFSRNGNFMHKNNLGNTNANQLRKSNQHQQSRDLNDFFFEKPNNQINKY